MSPTSFWPLILVTGVLVAFGPYAGAADEARIELVFAGGHETDPRDHGRPVSLVAGALGVKPEVFRTAFGKVKPAPAGTELDPGQVRRNKVALLGALARYGVTNDRLDRVSDYYRYRPGRGELWPVQAAAGYATIEGGAITSLVVTKPGSGYSSPPTVSIPGHPEWVLKADLAFDRDFKKNGSIASVTQAPAGGRLR